MARIVLQVLMIALGISAIVIGAAIFFAGPTFAGSTTEALYAALNSSAPPPSPPFTPVADSELRFYAPFWVVYGGVLIWTARGLAARMAWVPPLAGLFFAGGVGRLISLIVVGPPHPAFTMLMGSELVLPPLFVALWWAARRGRPGG